MKTSKNDKQPPIKTTSEDSIDVSTANAVNRYTDEEAAKGITKDGGNASADVKTKAAKKVKQSNHTVSHNANLGRSIQPPIGPDNKDE